jgi:hypothetical protein
MKLGEERPGSSSDRVTTRARIEIKLFAREPFALIFTFAFPLVVLTVLIGSFEPNNPGSKSLAAPIPVDQLRTCLYFAY